MRRFAFVVFTILLIIAIPTSAQTSAYTGIDIVFLVDQSGSMGGRDYGNSSNITPQDPDGLRFRAVQFAVDWLGSFRAQQALIDNGLDINAAVVNFGGINTPNGITSSNDIVERTMDWQPITPSSLEVWDNQRESLIEPLSAESFGQRNLGSTNFVTAFDEAFSLFEQQTNPDNLKVIVVLTDGEPCAPSLFTISLNCNAQQDQENHMNDLAANISREFGNPNNRVYTIAINSDPDEFGEYFINAWETITQDNLYQLTNSRQVGQTLNEILVELGELVAATDDGALTLGQQLDLRGGSTLVVPPYQQLMSITVFKTQTENTLQLTNPNGQVLPIDSTVNGAQTPIEMWRVVNPLPGRWQLDVGGGDNDSTASVDLLRAKHRVTTPDEGGQMFVPLPIRLLMTDNNGNPIARYADRDLEMSGQIRAFYLSSEDEDPAPIEVDLQPLNASSVAIFEGQFVPMQAGNWRISLEASASVDGADPVTVAESLQVTVDESQFVITNAQDIEVRAGSNLDVLENIEFAYTVNYIDERGTAIPVETDLFELSLSDSATCDGDADPLTDIAPDPQAFSASFQRVGEGQTLCARIDITDPTTNRPLTVFDGPFTSVNVEAVEALALRIVEPREVEAGMDFSLPDLDIESQRLGPLWGQAWLPIMPTWDPTPLDFTFEVVNRDGNPIDLYNSLESSAAYGPDNVFSLVWRDENGVESAPLALSPTDDPARWRAQLDPLAAGNYRMVVQAPTVAIGDTNRAFLAEDARPEYSLSIVSNSTIAAIQLGANVGYAVLLTLIIFSVIRLSLRIIHQMTNPITGQLVVLKRIDANRWCTVSRATGLPAIYDLADLSSNRMSVAIPIRALPPVDPAITKLQARTKLNRKGQLLVTIFVNGARQATDHPLLIEQGSLAPPNFLEFLDGGETYRLIWTGSTVQYSERTCD